LVFPLDAAVASIEASGVAAGIQHFVVDGDHRFDGTESLPALVRALQTS
jgi:hypothetical protein